MPSAWRWPARWVPRPSPLPSCSASSGSPPADRHTRAACTTRSRGSELIHPIQSPPTLDHRYLHEDVGWGLVPWMHLAVAAGSPAPTITALTRLAGVINGIDYSRQGLTLERMGLAGKTPAQIRAHVSTPCRTGRRPAAKS
jgi:hypothetical protein